MLKKFTTLTVLAFAFTFIAGSLQAQLNFFNGSACTVTVKASAENNATPCAGPLCYSGAVTIPPGGSAVLPFGLCFVSTAGLGYRAVKFSMVGGASGIADKCAGPNPFFFADCLNNPRQLRIFSPTVAGIF